MTYLSALFRSLGIAWVVFVATGVAAGAEPKLLDQKLLDEGWISLFDGETTYGWQPTGDAKWDVVDGEIRTDGSKPGFLMTTTEWADFALHVEFRAPAETNSGIFLRSVLEPKSPTKDCIELNIAARDNPFPTASFVGRKKVAAQTHPEYVVEGKHKFTLEDPKEEDPKEIDTWDNKWHTFEVGLVGGEVHTLSLDGEVIARNANLASSKESGIETPRIGHIGLQSNHGEVAFRNIRIVAEGLKPILKATSLEGWSDERLEKCQLELTKHGELHITNGPGQVETVADFTNFVLRLQCKVNGDKLNSGVFFRTLRQGHWAGYESQIQNGFKDDDRTKPSDYGTGAIYRRQPARRVVANDREWFTKTIVADGPHMAVWVNGYQVSDWTDTRPPKENAREGRRDAGGAIALQGHDATTDFLFRKIRAVELPGR